MVPYAAGHLAARDRPRAGCLSPVWQAERDRAAGGLLGQGEEILGLAPAQRVEDRGRDAVLQPDLLLTWSTRWFTHGTRSWSAPASPARRSVARSTETVVWLRARRTTGRRPCGPGSERGGPPRGRGRAGVSSVKTLREISSGTGVLPSAAVSGRKIDGRATLTALRESVRAGTTRHSLCRRSGRTRQPRAPASNTVRPRTTVRSVSGP